MFLLLVFLTVKQLAPCAVIYYDFVQCENEKICATENKAIQTEVLDCAPPHIGVLEY